MDAIIKFTAKYVIVLIVLVLAYVWWRLNKKDKIEMIVVTISAGILAIVVARLAGHLYYDPRPFVKSNVTPLLPHAADNGFPSDHALLSMTLTAVICFYRKKWAAVAFLLTIAVSAARVLAHVHSPIDIAGAWLIGALSAVLAVWIIHKTSWFKVQASAAADKQ